MHIPTGSHSLRRHIGLPRSDGSLAAQALISLAPCMHGSRHLGHGCRCVRVARPHRQRRCCALYSRRCDGPCAAPLGPCSPFPTVIFRPPIALRHALARAGVCPAAVWRRGHRRRKGLRAHGILADVPRLGAHHPAPLGPSRIGLLHVRSAPPHRSSPLTGAVTVGSGQAPAVPRTRCGSQWPAHGPSTPGHAPSSHR